MTNIKTFQLVVSASMYVAASSHSIDKNYVNSVTLAEAVDWGDIEELGGNAGNVSYTYNLYGWTTSIDSKDFYEELHYRDSLSNGNQGTIYFGDIAYSGNIIYRDSKLNKVLFPGGYCTFDKEENDLPIFHYYTQDHLGNNRVVTKEDGTVEQIVHYYPFGGTFNDAGLNTGLQQYKYNGKELDRIAGLNTYDYGARQYFSPMPTWDRMDSMAEYHYETSPYAYCGNNPVKRFDPDGNDYEVSFSFDESTGMGTATVSAIIYAFNEYDFSIAQKNANEINDLSGKFIYRAGTKTNPLNFTVNFNLQVQIANKAEKMAFTYNENSFEITNKLGGNTNGITQNGNNVGVKGSRANTSTVRHEFGHMLGMKHSEKGIMTAESLYRNSEIFYSNNINQTIHGAFHQNVEYDTNMRRIKMGKGYVKNNSNYSSEFLKKGKVINSAY